MHNQSFSVWFKSQIGHINRELLWLCLRLDYLRKRLENALKRLHRRINRSLLLRYLFLVSLLLQKFKVGFLGLDKIMLGIEPKLGLIWR